MFTNEHFWSLYSAISYKLMRRGCVVLGIYEIMKINVISNVTFVCKMYQTTFSFLSHA